MRTLLFLLFAASFTVATVAQTSVPSSTAHIRQLRLEASGLPENEQHAIIRQFENHDYPIDELSKQIRAKLQDLGYYKAAVYDPKVLAVGTAATVVDVSYGVDVGAKYRLSEIKVVHATVFSPKELQAVFRIKPGDIFSRSLIGEGLDNMRKVYDRVGYVNFTSVPDTMIDETKHLIVLSIDVDEGKPFNFGPLVLDGAEPHAGVGDALLTSWKALKGNRYDSLQSEQWLAESEKKYRFRADMDFSKDNKSQLITVKISFK